MSVLKGVFGFNGMDRVAKRIIAEAQQRKLNGDVGDFWVEYTQDEVGLRTSGTTAGP
jgi:hypothetical protein